jgi:hypothetical protein
VRALELTWETILARHPELPAVVVVLAAGSVGVAPGTLKLGQWPSKATAGNRMALRVPAVVAKVLTLEVHLAGVEPPRAGPPHCHRRRRRKPTTSACSRFCCVSPPATRGCGSTTL